MNWIESLTVNGHEFSITNGFWPVSTALIFTPEQASALTPEAFQEIREWFLEHGQEYARLRSTQMADEEGMEASPSLLLTMMESEAATPAMKTWARERLRNGFVPPERQQKTPRKLGKGIVYILSLKEQPDLFKIGLSRKIRQRLSTINSGLPFDTSVHYSVECDDPEHIESQLHERFKAKRVRGEWFRLDEEDIRGIEEAYPAEVR